MMDNSTTIIDAIWTQFGASLDMLENAINMCPEEHSIVWTHFCGQN